MNSDTNSKNTAHEINAVNVANDAQKIAPKATQQSSCETADAEFKPLTTTFKAVINEPYSKLGSELQKLWSQKISPYVHWDNASFYERLKRVEIFDRLNDPQKEDQRKKELDAYAQAFEIYAEIGEVEIEAQKIELMNPQDLSQDAHKKSEKHRFNQEIGRLMQKLELMTDEQTAPSLPTSDSDQISAIENPAPAPERPSDEYINRRVGWRDVAMGYILDVMKSGQHATAKELYKALMAKAGPDSPFDKGVGHHNGTLYLRELAQPLSIKTIQNEWGKLRKQALE